MPDFSSFTPEQIASYTNAFVKIVVTIAVLAWLIVYRSAIADVFRTLTKLTLKAIGFEASAEFNGLPRQEKKEEKTPQSKEEQAEPGKLESEEVSPMEEEEAPTTLMGWEREMLFRSLMNEQEKMQTAYDEGLKLANSDTDKHKLEIAYSDYQVRFFKDNSYISKIQYFTDAAKYEPVVVERAFSVLGNIRFMLKDYAKSNEHYELALSVGEDTNRKCFYERKITRNRYELGQKEDALNDYGALLKKYTEPEQQIEIYKELAELYEEAGDDELRALATEKALELGDDDHRTYFNAAYSYSRSNFDKLSLLHYQRAMKLGSGEGSLNNMGVQYEQLGMPLKSIEHYQKAFSENNTLAAANIAYRLIGAGFLQEAKEILEKAQAKKDEGSEVHENVYSALASIKAEQEKETKKETSVLKDASEQQGFFRGYAESYFKESDVFALDVNYFPERDVDIRVEVKEGRITGTWIIKRKSQTSDYEWTDEFKFEGELHNKAAKVVFYEKTILTSDKFQKETEGYLYIQDSQHIKLLLKSKYSEQNYNKTEIIKKSNS